MIIIKKKKKKKKKKKREREREKRNEVKKLTQGHNIESKITTNI